MTAIFTKLKSLRPLRIIIAVVVLLGVMLGGILIAQDIQAKHHVEQAAKSGRSFVEAVNSGKLDKAYSQLTTPATKRSISKEDFVYTFETLRADKPKLSQEKIEINKKDKDKATYKVKVSNLTHTDSGKTTGTFTLGLLYTDDKWLVDSAEVR